MLLGLGFVLGPAYWIGNQAIVQRTLGAKSQSQARASYLLCAAIKLVFPVLLVWILLMPARLIGQGDGPVAWWKSVRFWASLITLIEIGVCWQFG